jgi:hypothetical protein
LGQIENSTGYRFDSTKAIGHLVNSQGADHVQFYLEAQTRRIQTTEWPLLLLPSSNVAEAANRTHRQIQNQ